jgi:hypothetical protein
VISGIDSMILVYAGVVPRKAGADGIDPVLIERAQILLHKLRNEIVVLPMVAVSELLVPVSASKRGLLVTTLDEMFVCRPFDQLAAAIAADIWAQHKKLPADLRYDDRQVLRADAMIVASAKAANATNFYTNDDRCRALASLVMRGRELPIHSGELFTKQMIEEGNLELPKKPTRKKRSAKKSK